METRPNMNKYRGLASASVIDIIASINLVAGVACIVLGIMGNNALSGTAGIISGISCMVVACFLFIISNIAQDIHWQAYMTEYYGEEAANYHEQSLRKLQSIEWYNPIRTWPYYWRKRSDKGKTSKGKWRSSKACCHDSMCGIKG